MGDPSSYTGLACFANTHTVLPLAETGRGGRSFGSTVGPADAEGRGALSGKTPCPRLSGARGGGYGVHTSLWGLQPVLQPVRWGAGLPTSGASQRPDP